MRYKKTVAVVVVTISVFTLLTTWDVQKNSLSSLGFRVSGIDHFVVEDRFKPHFSDNEEEIIFARGKAGILRLTIISNITKQFAEKYASSQSLLFEGMFDQKLPPYPEFLTSETGCAEEFLPQRKETLSGSYYTIYADERYHYGICAHDLAKYKAGVGFFYCENLQKAVKLAYFVDTFEDFGTVDELMNSFVCDTK